MTSIIKVNNIQNQCGQNIINENSNTITIGASGDTIALAAGASQTGFGASGAVTWDTTVKTTGFTATSGTGFFVDTTSGGITVTLPASPSAGNIVAIADYAGTAGTNAISIGRNGSNFQGAAQDGKISVDRQVFTLVYVDATQGWVPVAENDSTAAAPKFIAATGGSITCGACGNTKIHTFTGPGTFCVSCAGNEAGSNILNYMVIAGGGGGGGPSGRYENGGGGAGGYREANDSNAKAPFAASILANTTGLTAAAGPISVTVGAGGSNNSAGSNSIFSTITSAGGGAGSTGNGGSGGGGQNSGAGGNGNTPAVSPPQGNPGGTAGGSPPANAFGGGGGGAGATGGPSTSAPITGGKGGDGVENSINDTLTIRAGGGGGSGPPSRCNQGGLGGGGPARQGPSSGSGTSATANTGSGGGAGYNGTAGSGGSGVVIIRYKFQ